MQGFGWTGQGLVVGKRELRTKKDNTVWAYSITVESWGGTHELTTREKALFDSVRVGPDMLTFAGKFNKELGDIRLEVFDVSAVAAKKAA